VSAAGCCFRSLQKIGRADGERLRQRVAAELKTTFASHYTQVVSLQEALQPSNIDAYAKRATGEKYLIISQQDWVTCWRLDIISA